METKIEHTEHDMELILTPYVKMTLKQLLRVQIREQHATGQAIYDLIRVVEDLICVIKEQKRYVQR